MLEFMKDGKKVSCPEIWQNGQVGQVVVLTEVYYSSNADPEKFPFATYAHPSFFTILKKLPDPRRNDDKFSSWCLVRDATGKEFACELSNGIYDAQQWGLWNDAKQTEEHRKMNARIQHVESQVALLRGILVDQGVKVISQEQARLLGIKEA